MTIVGLDACLDADVAASYAAHLLADAELLAIDDHIDACAACRELVSAVAKLQFATSSDDSVPLEGAILPRGTRVGPFAIERPLDAGGMGLVYEASDARLDRKVALKGVHDVRGRSDELLLEARAMAQLAHPNVVPVYDVIEAHDQIFLAMELVVGRSVRQWIDAEPRGWQAIVDVFLAAGTGLGAAHAAAIVHGDVKPANLLVGDDGRVRITDFGLASAPGSESTGRGTPAYMAPEQRAGAPSDAAADRYAFCASLHEALFGAVPGRAPTKQPRIPRALRTILARGLATDPAARFASMPELLRALRRVRHPRGRWIAAGLAAAAAIGALAFALGHGRVQAELCATAAPQLETRWTPETRGVVERAFARTGTLYAPDTLARVEAALDRHTGALDAARERACTTGLFHAARPPDELSAELRCLEERVRETRALVSQFLDADLVTVQNAIAATAQLRPPSECAAAPVAHAAALPASHALELWRSLLAKQRALENAGKFRDAYPLAAALVAAADALGEPSLRATALVTLGDSAARLGKYDDAVKALQQALRLADASQSDVARCAAWVNLVKIEYLRGHHEQVGYITDATLGACERTNEVYLQSEAMLNIGGALSQQGKIAEAQARFAAAVELRVKLYGEADSRTGDAYSALGNGLAMAGQLDAGIAAHRKAIAITEAALGQSHPNVAIGHDNLGDDLIYGLQPAEAVAQLELGEALLEKLHGAGPSRDVAEALTDLGQALREAGQSGRAAETFARAEAMWRAVNPKHPDRAMALLGVYQTGGERANLDDALALAAGLPPFMRAQIQLALGLASQSPRARALIAEAAKGFATSPLPLNQREGAVASAWLVVDGVAP